MQEICMCAYLLHFALRALLLAALADSAPARVPAVTRCAVGSSTESCTCKQVAYLSKQCFTASGVLETILVQLPESILKTVQAHWHVATSPDRWCTEQRMGITGVSTDEITPVLEPALIC